ncbi:MAG TPA: amidase [Xanthobacteraceae bacterium]|nr:amidase [Xanthobacteraceae bacterium]
MASLDERRAISLHALAAKLSSGSVTSRALVEECLERIEAKDGEGGRTFISVNTENARREADAQDKLRTQGRSPSSFAGIPVSIKDLFDVEGMQTRAGSTALNDTPVAQKDAPAVARLRAAGFVIVGRTNMTEFAYSGLGLNPHYGTPASKWDRDTRRVPGGSSSGAAISVADGMAHAGFGTDTGGSCRIPAAFNYLTGYKPTARRVAREGVLPLSTSLDSVGPIARTVACCSAIDKIIADRPREAALESKAGTLRLGVLRTLVESEIEDAVAAAYEAALSKLSKAGIELSDFEMPELGDLAALGANGGISAAESFRWHRELLQRKANEYDPRVKSRILRGEEQTAEQYRSALQLRRQFIEATEKRVAPFDAVIMPTVPVVPPAIDALASDEAYTRVNLLVLRNPSIINLMDGCAISLPISAPDSPPVGLMLAAAGGCDAALFRIASAVEEIVGV